MMMRCWLLSFHMYTLLPLHLPRYHSSLGGQTIAVARIHDRGSPTDLRTLYSRSAHAAPAENSGVSDSRKTSVFETVSFHVRSRSDMRLIWAVCRTRGWTQWTRSVWSTWSSVPLMIPSESARITSSSTSPTCRRAASAMASNGTVRSAVGPMRWKSISVRLMSVIFSLRKVVFASSAGCSSSFARCDITSASYCEMSPALKARSRSASQANCVASSVATTGCSRSSPKLYSPSPTSAAIPRSNEIISFSSSVISLSGA
mmetsp:Transcript_12906/g.33053  ORF Transcript_12906/g.33053 Transcript_12906/m.33053 type:complete len:259 (+) Transcript_12906:58-834(+)